MPLATLVQKIFFRLRITSNIWSPIRRFWWRMLGAKIGVGTNVPRLEMIWPHQVSIGRNCILEPDIFFKFPRPWQSGPSIVVGDRVFIGKGCEFNICEGIRVADDCLIASGCKFVDANHGTADISLPMNKQAPTALPIHLDRDVWLGVNVVVLKGVSIGQGAIVGAGAVVTKSIPSNEIWAGIPARKIGQRPTT